VDRRPSPSAEDLQNFPGEDKKGSVVVKFSPEGNLFDARRQVEA